MLTDDLIRSIAECAGCMTERGCHNHMPPIPRVNLTQARGVAKKLYGTGAEVVRIGSGNFQMWVLSIDQQRIAEKYSGLDLVRFMIGNCRNHGKERA